MAVTIALLQGVNIGKYKRIAMADLKKIVQSLGGEQITTVANSGNVVFTQSDSADQEILRQVIEDAVSNHIGMPIPLLIRSRDEMQQTVSANPFPNVTDPKCLHVEFLLEARPDALSGIEFGEDHLALMGREIYLHLPNKMTGHTFDGRTLNQQLGTHHTSRSWNTVMKLAKIAERVNP